MQYLFTLQSTGVYIIFIVSMLILITLIWQCGFNTTDFILNLHHDDIDINTKIHVLVLIL